MYCYLPNDLIVNELLKYNTFYSLFLIDKRTNQLLNKLKHNYVHYYDDYNVVKYIKKDDLNYKLKYNSKWFNVNLTSDNITINKTLVI